MPGEDLYLTLEQEMSLRTYRQNRDELTTFYRNLGQMSKEKIPETILAEDSTKQLEEAEALLSEKIRVFAKTCMDASANEVNASVGRLAISMFLLERTRKLREAALKNDRISLYSLYVSLRNQICLTLVESYYSKLPEAVIADFLDVEPILTACSDLCGLEMPPLGEIVSNYKKPLIQKLEQIRPPAVNKGK